MGFGNPDAEIAVMGYSATDGYNIWLNVSRLAQRPMQDVTVTGNVFDIMANQDKNRDTRDYGEQGNAVVVSNTDGVTITDNDFGNLGVAVMYCTNYTVEDVAGIVHIRS